MCVHVHGFTVCQGCVHVHGFTFCQGCVVATVWHYNSVKILDSINFLLEGQYFFYGVVL